MSRQAPSAVPDNLPAALGDELTRVRDEVLPAYRDCGSAAIFALRGLDRDLREGEAAMRSGDAVRMETAWRALYGWDT